LRAGDSVGESALVMEVRREATVQAMTPTLTLQLVKEDIADLPVDLRTIRQHIIVRMLEAVPFFRDHSRAQLDALGLIMDVLYASPGEVLFREGDVGQILYVLAEGSVAMHQAVVGKEDKLLEVYDRRSDRPWFGEVALLKHEPRKATAIVVEPSKLVVLRSDHFAEFLAICPTFHSMFSMATNAFIALNEISEIEDHLQQSDLEVKYRVDPQTRAGVAVSHGFIASRALEAWERFVKATLNSMLMTVRGVTSRIDVGRLPDSTNRPSRAFIS